jgi:hypothetical protein
MYGAQRSTLQKVDKIYLGNFEMWCWRRLENINGTDCVRNEKVLPSIKVERNILQTIKKNEG